VATAGDLFSAGNRHGPPHVSPYHPAAPLLQLLYVHDRHAKDACGTGYACAIASRSR
jgi:hypothetical protein